ncbi:SirA-like protein [Pseudomonas syringae pv. atrofaciens]|nr:SirA-like protein [Pseudomonas syringae pv. atrofaciens]
MSAWRETMSDAVVRPEACDAELDASGLNCPLPLLKAKMELNRLASGAVLKVIATDAGSQRDFRTFARLAGHELLHEEVDAGIYRYWLRKA